MAEDAGRLQEEEKDKKLNQNILYEKRNLFSIKEKVFHELYTFNVVFTAALILRFRNSHHPQE